MGEEASNKSRRRLWAWLGVAAVLCMGTLILRPAVIKPFLLALACGGIAFFGDWIGRRIGKRRYSLFQLRPRTTATVVTILTGVFIAGFLQAVIFNTSENARQAFFHFREFKAAYQKLRADYQNLHNLWDDLKRRIPPLQNRVQKLEQDQKKAQRERDTAQRERDQAQQERDQAQRNLDREKQQVMKAQSEYHQVEKQLGKLQDQIKRNQEQLKRTEAELKRTETELKRAEGDLKDKKEELANAEEECFKSYRQGKVLEKELEERQAEIASLEAQRDLLVAQRDLLVAQRDLLVAQRDLLVSGIATAQKEIDDLQWSLRELTRAAAAGELRLQLFLERDVIYHAGELLVQAVVDGTRPVKAIRERLEELLEIASTRAALRGAARGEHGRYVRAFLPVSVGGEVRLFLEEKLLDNFAQFLAERKESVVLQILAVRNTVEGECVFVEFARPQPNRCIFRSGDEITRRVIDGTLSDVEIFTVLLDMRKDVRAEAQARGMIPTLPGGMFGDIAYTELFPVMHRVQDARGSVTVRILANQETWTSDPLEIRFAVGEGASQ